MTYPLLRRRRGVALVSALLLVALATTIAVAVGARASQRIRNAENAQMLVQAISTARAGIEFGRWALRRDQVEDNRAGTPVDSLTEAWAQALPAFPVEGGSVSGVVHDAQALINLNNLGLNRTPADLLVMRTLLLQNHLNPDLAGALADWVDADSAVTLPGGAEDGDYLALDAPRLAANRPLADVDELLRVRGFTPAIVAALRPWVCALPVHTPVNLNTAPTEVIAALFQVGKDAAEALVTLRNQKPFTGPSDLQIRAPTAIQRRLGSAASGTRVAGTAGVVSPGSTAVDNSEASPQWQQDWDVRSRFFQIDARATYARVQYGLSALVRRETLQTNPTYPTILWERRTLF